MIELFKTTVIGSSILNGAVDNHSHILFGVDDGIQELEESLETLAYLEGLGLKELWLTPHIMEDVPNTTAGLKARFQELKDAYQGHIKLHLAAEYMLDTLFEERLAARDLLEHGDSVVLVETSIVSPPMDLWGILERIKSAGYWPLMAHPERYSYMSPGDYKRLNQMGVRLQMNIPSIVGYYGQDVKARAENLLSHGWYCMTGSDCHRLSTLRRQYEDLKTGKKTLSKLADIHA